MTQSSKNNGFTAEDIRRYHEGTLSPAERHALEKAALDDPFLEDALAGYAYTADPAGDLASIRNRLEERLAKRKVVPLYARSWMKIAAMVLVIAGSGWLVYRLSTKE